MKDGMIRLYTRQNEKTLLSLEKDGRLINRRIYAELHFGDIAPHYMPCYDWFVAEAARRVPKPADAELPIWCALRPAFCLPPIEGTVVYIFEAPQNEVIFFDDAKWDFVLNRRYLPADGADEAAYQRHLEQLDVANSFEFFTGRYAGKYPQEERRIKDSWQRVFDLPDRSIRSACGNVWELRKEQILRIVRPGESIMLDEDE